MKIRKLIISAKLEQIENKNQNIFIFHCSVNANQWRDFKNFLFHKTTEKLQNSQKLYLLSPQGLNSQFEEDNSSFVRAYTFFQSLNKKKLAVTKGLETLESSETNVIARNRSKVKTNTNYSSIRASGNQILSPSTKFVSNKNKSKPKGCLLFFDTSSKLAIKSHQKNSQCFELINKIESLEFNKNLILLYGRVNSTLVNHVDVKEALNLETKGTYQELLTSMSSTSLGLSFCLDQQIGQFFQCQEMRTELSENTSRRIV